MDLTKALEFLAANAVKANGNRFFKVPGEPEHVYHLIHADGRVSTELAAQPLDAHAALDVATVVALAVGRVGLMTEPTPGDIWPIALWYSFGGVVAVLGEEGDRAALALTPSVPFRTIEGWAATAAGGSLSHQEIVTALRTTFAGCFDAHPDLRDAVKKVDIKKAQEAKSEIGRSGVSMSRSLVAEASGADKLPDPLWLDVPAFAEAEVKVRVRLRVAFELDSQAERFRLVPLPGEIEAARAAAEDHLRLRVAEALGEASPVPVYHGRP